MAPTWNTQPTTATAHPIAHHFDRNRSVALLSGARRLTAGAATAPRCFHRNPRFVAIAVATANTSPISSRSSIVPSRRPSPRPVLWGSRRLDRSNATGPRVSADRQDASARAETRSRSRFLLVAVDSRARHVDPGSERPRALVEQEQARRAQVPRLEASATRCGPPAAGQQTVICALLARANELGQTEPVPAKHYHAALEDGWIDLPAHGLEALASRP